MDSQAGHVMTIANSIIGVSLLAMPYCFKQCGIVLSVLILILSNAISRLSCHLMLKSAVMARRRTFEFLAFHAFGPFGKFITEIGLIGFLLGTCIAYFVVMGDLGPAIVAKMTSTRATDTMRTSILMALALFCVLPLGLLRNIDSLNSVSTATIGFYFCLVLKIIAESAPHIFSGDWVSKVELWRPAGILQCLPIFSMSLSCQTQIFEVYQAIPTASLEKMNNLIRVAVNICTGVYIFVGIFGYIAFANQTFSGNILMSFSTSFISDVMKIGFVLSLAFSFPLIIFPCRASLYSLLYKRTYALHEGSDKYIPESRFKGLTFIIVFVSLVIGVMIPTIELVLGLVGSTIGIMICVLFPATCFICMSTKNTNERILAQIMLFIGVLIMVLGTYTNLYAMEEISTAPVVEKVTIPVPEILKLVEEDPALKVIDIPNTTKAPIGPAKKEEPGNQDALREIRHEPPQPEEPAESPPEVHEIKKVDVIKDSNNEQQANAGVKEEVGDKSKDSNGEKPVSQVNSIAENDKKEAESPVLQQPINESNDIKSPEAAGNKLDDVNKAAEPAVENNDKIKKVREDPAPKAVDANLSLDVPIKTDKPSENNLKEQEVDAKSSGKKIEEVDIEAIKKEEKELQEQEKEKLKEEQNKNLDLIKKMEKQNEDQKKLEKLLEEFKQQKKELEKNKEQSEIDLLNQKKIKAVEQIEQIAKEAIEKLSGGDQNQDKKIQSQDKKDIKDNQIEEVVKEAKEKLIGEHKENEIKKTVEIGHVDQNQIVRDQHRNVEIGDKPNNQNPEDRKPINENKVKDKANSIQNSKDINFKLGLNEANVVPLPIAISNNFSGSYRNLIGPAKDVPKDNIPKVQAVDNTKLKEKIDLAESKPHVEKKTNSKNVSEEAILKKDRDQINLLDVLKTNAEKVTTLKLDKTEKIIQHREIRSINDKEAFQENDMDKALSDNKEIELSETLKQREINNELFVKKSEDSCDKDERNRNNPENVNNDDNRADSTETPLIKMITKLSSPELVSIKLPDLDKSILKPLKRDLKSYKFRKRK